MVTSHLGDKPSRRQSSRRQTNSATRVGQLGDNLFRLSVCFVLIEQNKLSKKAVLSQGNHAMLLLISNMGYWMSKNQRRWTLQHPVLLFDQFRTARSMTEGLHLLPRHHGCGTVCHLSCGNPNCHRPMDNLGVHLRHSYLGSRVTGAVWPLLTAPYKNTYLLTYLLH